MINWKERRKMKNKDRIKYTSDHRKAFRKLRNSYWDIILLEAYFMIR